MGGEIKLSYKFLIFECQNKHWSTISKVFPVVRWALSEEAIKISTKPSGFTKTGIYRKTREQNYFWHKHIQGTYLQDKIKNKSQLLIILTRDIFTT